MVPNITITTRRSLIIADGRRSGFAEAGLFRVSVFRWRYRGDLRRRWAVWCNDLSARRGSAYQIFERYLALAREAAASGDRIAADGAASLAANIQAVRYEPRLSWTVWKPMPRTSPSGLLSRGTESSQTLRWRRQSRANSSLKPNSLLAGKIQGILFVWASECAYWLAIQHQTQWLTTQFPTHRNREFIWA